MTSLQTAPLQILVVVGSLDLGGTERHLCQIMPLLQGNGMEITVATFHNRGHLAPEMERRGVPVLEPHFPKWLRRNRACRVPATLLWMATIIAKRRPDIVHTFLPAAYLLGGLCATFLGVPGRVMSRRSLNRYQQQHAVLAHLEYWLHGKMGLLIGNSLAVVNELNQETGTKTARIRLILNGIDADNFANPKASAQIRSEIHVPEDALLIVVVANLIPYKGHSDLLDALRMVAHQLPNPWRLICIGRDDGPLRALKIQAQRSDLAKNIIWLGPRTDVPDLLCASDIGVLSSHEEGLSNAILEGMAASLPMVVTNVGGNTELVVNEETGLVVPAHMPHRLGNAIVTLAIDKARRRAMGMAARDRLTSKFSISHCVQNYRQAYLSLGLTPRKGRHL